MGILDQEGHLSHAGLRYVKPCSIQYAEGRVNHSKGPIETRVGGASMVIIQGGPHPGPLP